ncbi:hypothetical protein M413DRAFT_113232 [Hebeloma cylindrosporum]|uniref:Uncharacterized protein n=1 Tax=Hebeloma cylindrosporum TaxID=76867 RepID=A0A0C3CZR8_HEBCY|nr:hypothetical protein M413DRAFT_113232 [Hebeloma cylindrosporum h7]
MTATCCKPETAASLLCSRLSERVAEFSQTYDDMKCTSIEDRLSTWTAFEGQIEGLVIKFQGLVPLAQVVCGSSEITLNQLEALQGNSNAIGAGAVDLMKKQRMEAFQFEAMKASTPSVRSPKLSDKHSGYPVEKFNIDNIGELSYILPEKHGWLLVFSKELCERLLSTPRFRFVLEISGDEIVDYGIYKASKLRGQALSGLEFSHLTDKTKEKITEAISQAKAGTPKSLETMEDLLYSKQSIPCIFLECLETSARSRQVSDQQSTDWDVHGLQAVHPFPSEELTCVGTRSSPTYAPSSSSPLQSIANRDLRRANETKVPAIISIPISRNCEGKHRGASGNISDQEN